MPRCKDCGEVMEGDGYSYVCHCPYAPEHTYDTLAPDDNPVSCGFDEEDCEDDV